MIGCIVEGEYSGLVRRALVRVPSGIMAAAGNGRLRDGLSLRLFKVPRWRNLCSIPLRYSKNLGIASTNRIMLEMRRMSNGALKGKITNALKDTSELLLAFARGTRLNIRVGFPAPDEITTDAESFQTQIDEFSKHLQTWLANSRVANRTGSEGNSLYSSMIWTGVSPRTLFQAWRR